MAAFDKAMHDMLADKARSAPVTRTRIVKSFRADKATALTACTGLAAALI